MGPKLLRAKSVEHGAGIHSSASDGTPETATPLRCHAVSLDSEPARGPGRYYFRIARDEDAASPSSGQPSIPAPVPEASPAPQDDLMRSLSGSPLPDPQQSLVLLARAKRGDRMALEELIARYQDRLQRIVRIQLGSSYLRRDYDSMDIVQNTFRAALPTIADLEPHSAAGLLQWLAMIATNQIRDAHSRRRAEKRDVGRERELDSVACNQAVAKSDDGSPLNNALLAEVRELLDEEVAGLPEEQRKVVLLRDYCGQEWPQIATELERDQGAARQLHQRAWIRLRRVLRPKLEGRE